MARITPNWTDNVEIIAPVSVSALGLAVRGTLDLRSKLGARIFCRIGRLQTTALATGIGVYIRPVFNNDGALGSHPAYLSYYSQYAVTVVPTINSDAAAGATSIVVSSGTSMAADDTICITDATFTRLEFKTVTRVSGTTLYLDSPLNYAHTAAQADKVSRLSDCFPAVTVPGGSLYEVIFNYGRVATGGNVVVCAHAQTYDSNTSA